MAETSIQWTDFSVNPIRFGKGHYCQKISPGCTNCYASASQPRFGNPGFGGSGGELPLIDNGAVPLGEGMALDEGDPFIWFDESKLREVLRRRKRTKYFWCDMTDLFGSWVPEGWIDSCFRTMIKANWHTHQVLTKRADRMLEYISKRWGRFNGVEYPLPDCIWLGVSVEDQARADERIPLLLRTPAAVRFLSVEPLLSAVDLEPYLWEKRADLDHHGALAPRFERSRLLHWVIIGGESGPRARPCQVEWIRSLVRQCKAASVPCFVKQLGADPRYRSGEYSQPNPRYGAPVELLYRLDGITDPKGGDMAEWEPELRVREYPHA